MRQEYFFWSGVVFSEPFKNKFPSQSKLTVHAEEEDEEKSVRFGAHRTRRSNDCKFYYLFTGINIFCSTSVKNIRGSERKN